MEPYVARLTQPGTCSSARKRGSVGSKGKLTPTSASGLTFGTSAPENASDNDDDLLQGEPDQMTRDSNCWGRLEQELSKYVTTCKLSNVLPTDKQLQDHARMIIYEDDDPWNWTCADSQQWLDTFKFQQGIGEITEAMEGKKATLEEVPVLAPYVVKGGNKSGAKNAAHARAGSNVKRMSTGAIQDFKTTRNTGVNRTGSWNVPAATAPMIGKNALTGAGVPPSALPDFDPNMEMDFDAIDFQTLDLGMAGMGMDDVTMTTGADFPGTMATTTGGENMSALSAALNGADDAGGTYAPANGQPMMDLGMGGFDLQAQQGDMAGSFQEPLMSEAEMNELAGYSASFH